MSAIDHLTPEQDERNQALVDSAMNGFLEWAMNHRAALLIGRHYGFDIAISDRTREGANKASRDKNALTAIQNIRGFDPSLPNTVYST